MTGRYVFVVEATYDIEQDSVGFFAEYEMAKEYAFRRIQKDRDEGGDLLLPNWCIEKQLIVRDKCDLRVRGQNRLNPYMFPETADAEEEDEDYDGWRISAVGFDRECRIRYLNTGEMSREEVLAVDPYNPSRFGAPFF